jgi:hypothetical protein
MGSTLISVGERYRRRMKPQVEALFVFIYLTTSFPLSGFYTPLIDGVAVPH